MAQSKGDVVVSLVEGLARELGREAIVEKEYDPLYPVYPLANRYDVSLRNGDAPIHVGYYVFWRETGVLDTFVDTAVLPRAQDLGPVQARQEHSYGDLAGFRTTMMAALRAAAGQ